MSTQQWTVGLDADDTLWHCEREFRDIQDRFSELMQPWAGSTEVAANELEAVERRNLEIFGYGVKGFTLSMVDTAIMMSDGGVSADDIHRIVSWGKDLLGKGSRGLHLIDGVADVLESLRGHRCVVITKGDLFEQETKVAASGLADYFDAVEVVAEKTPRSYSAVLGRLDIDPATFVFAGNSVKSDVLPVLEVGAVAALVPYPLVWSHEEADFPDAHPKAAQLTTLRDLPDFVAHLDAGQAPDEWALPPAVTSPG